MNNNQRWLFALFFGCIVVAGASCGSTRTGGGSEDDDDGAGGSGSASASTTSSSGLSSSSGGGSGGAGGGAVEDAGADGSGEDASSGPDATWHDFSAMSGTWQARKPLQSTASCETQPPIGEYVTMTIAANHGGPAVGEYTYCSSEQGTFSTQRCFNAVRMVGATGMDIAVEGDTLELLAHDEATGLSSGVLTTAKQGTYTFQATHCE